jgi:hypothetical protein
MKTKLCCVNPMPLIVSVKPALPASALAGERLEMLSGFGAAL